MKTKQTTNKTASLKLNETLKATRKGNRLVVTAWAGLEEGEVAAILSMKQVALVGKAYKAGMFLASLGDGLYTNIQFEKGTLIPDRTVEFHDNGDVSVGCQTIKAATFRKLLKLCA